MEGKDSEEELDEPRGRTDNIVHKVHMTRNRTKSDPESKPTQPHTINSPEVKKEVKRRGKKRSVSPTSLSLLRLNTNIEPILRIQYSEVSAKNEDNYIIEDSKAIVCIIIIYFSQDF